MRYVYYILLILIVLSAVMCYELYQPSIPARDIAVVINGEVITVKDFNRIRSSPSQRMESEDDLINSLITRELLIQEAQREGIDKEEPFRRSIQNFYEESLIKLLMDKKFASLKVSVSDRQLNRYISFLGRKLLLTVYTAATLEDAEKGNYNATGTREVSFNDLSGDMRYRISLLKEKQETKPLREKGNFIVLKLDKVGNSSHTALSETDRENIRKMLADQEKEAIMSEWVDGLRQKASVKVMLNRKD